MAEHLVRISETAVMLIAVGVAIRVGVWISKVPKALDELVPLLVGFEGEKCLPFIAGNDVQPT
jgi:hypothetical protein